jgi:hypothetical protein
MSDTNERSVASAGSVVGEPPFASAACPRCGLTFWESVDSSSFTADEMRAVQCGANALRVAARRVASYDDFRKIELMADHIDAMLSRLG